MCVVPARYGKLPSFANGLESRSRIDVVQNWFLSWLKHPKEAAPDLSSQS